VKSSKKIGVSSLLFIVLIFSAGCFSNKLYQPERGIKGNEGLILLTFDSNVQTGFFFLPEKTWGKIARADIFRGETSQLVLLEEGNYSLGDFIWGPYAGKISKETRKTSINKGELKYLGHHIVRVEPESKTYIWMIEDNLQKSLALLSDKERESIKDLSITKQVFVKQGDKIKLEESKQTSEKQ